MDKHTLLIHILLLWHIASSKNIIDELKSRREFSKFSIAVEASSGLLKLSLQERSFTLFLPTNEAMDKYTGNVDESFVRYHLVNRPYKIQDLPDKLGSDLEGNPSLYVTKSPSGQRSYTGWENNNYFINNAKVKSANLAAKGVRKAPQYIHTIDRVLAPTVPQIPDDDQVYTNPDALMVLHNANVYGLKNEYDIRDLSQKVYDLKADNFYKIEGKNTFFLPVDQAFRQHLRNGKDMYDKKVVQGHIVPDHVLFTRTSQDTSQQYESLAFNEKLKVYISMQNATDPETNESIFYVSSSIVTGSTKHTKGTAMAKIIKGNIPVRNGVLHIIDRPLMIIATNIMSYLQPKDGQMSKFHTLMNEHYPDLVDLLITEKDLTLFAPSNSAFDVVNQEKLNEVISNRERITEMLKLHIVHRRLVTDEIVERSLREAFQEETMSANRKLFFAVNNSGVTPTVTLEGAGVNATITVPNVVTTNGVIHVIDRLLGIPSQTVFEKLQSDPMLSSTFALSNQRNWNRQLKDRNKKFTLFVPSNDAWDYIKKEMNSAYKKLFTASYPKHASNILERHMIVNQALTLEKLSAFTTNTTPIREDTKQTSLQMTRGRIYFQARIRKNFGGDTKEYFMEWQGLTSKVIRPDVECINGVVHVIDRVLMSRNDVTVNGSGSEHQVGILGFLLTLLSAAVAWSLN